MRSGRFVYLLLRSCSISPASEEKEAPHPRSFLPPDLEEPKRCSKELKEPLVSQSLYGQRKEKGVGLPCLTVHSKDFECQE